MGAADSFEFRRTELREMRGGDVIIDDEMVTQSFLDLVAKDGLLTKYMHAGQIALILGTSIYLNLCALY